MNSKTIILGLTFILLTGVAMSQRIVVDTTSANKYIIKEPLEKEEVAKKEEDPSFSDRALSIGKGILNRLKARLNLEEASESLKQKKEKLIGKKEGEEKDSEKEEKKDGGN